MKRPAHVLRALPLAITFSSSFSASAAINSAAIIASSLSPTCLEYQVVEICYWMLCINFGCKIRTSTKVRHYVPDAVASAYSSTGMNPWVEMSSLGSPIAAHKIIINDAKALVHTISGTAMLVTPRIFKRFVQEFPALESQAKAQNLNAWQLLQRSFEKLKLHRKTETSLNIWTVNVVGPRSTKKLRGYLLNDPLKIFSEVPFDNVSLSLNTPSTEGAQ